ncbi:HpcH/HpaI aldolase family protein [Labrys neptuniae]
MRKNILRTRWREGGTIINGWLAIPNSFSAEVMAQAGWDSLTIDLQHGMHDYASSIAMLQAISTTSVVPLARVPSNESGIIGKMLDAGCYGLICPLVNTAEDAHAFITACRYPPRGRRSFGPIRASLYAGADYGTHANDEIVTFAMIETKEALDNLDDILAVDGLDAVYIGPADLSIALNCTAKFDQEEKPVVEAIDLIVRKAREKGIVAGIQNGTPAYARRMIDLGFQFITIASDARMITARSTEILVEIRGRPSAAAQSTTY